jgi:methyl-accepting chemotaxis protein
MMDKRDSWIPQEPPIGFAERVVHLATREASLTKDGPLLTKDKAPTGRQPRVAFRLVHMGVAAAIVLGLLLGSSVYKTTTETQARLRKVQQELDELRAVRRELDELRRARGQKLDENHDLRETAQSAAERAKDAEERAQSAAERAKDAEERAQSAAERAKDAEEHAQNAAERAKDAEEHAQNAAERAKDAEEHAQSAAERAKDAEERSKSAAVRVRPGARPVPGVTIVEHVRDVRPLATEGVLASGDARSSVILRSDEVKRPTPK